MSNWTVKGTYLEACNCEAICPCVVFSPPTEGSCTVLIGWHIDEGRHEGTVLDGLNAALLAHSPGEMKDGNWKVALYVDDRAEAAQSQALMGIFSGQAGGHLASLGPLIGEVLGARPATVSFDSGDQQFRLVVDTVGAIEIEAISGQAGGPVTVAGHPLAISPGATATVARARGDGPGDFGLTLDVNGKSALFAPFSYSG
jgi:hypothetical protein